MRGQGVALGRAPELTAPVPARRAHGVAGPLRLALAAVLLPAALPSSGDDAPAPASREVRVVMGTTAEVRVAGLADPTGALDGAFRALDLVEQRLSLWRESELAALDRAGGGTVSEETFEVVAHALEVAAASGGAFDPTVEPLVRAAGGFGAAPRALGEAERGEVRARVDHRLVTLDPATRTVRLGGGARLCLDALAKGDAADRALAAIREAGASSGLVDLGGSSIAVFGAPLAVELRDPTGEGRPWGAFVLADAALGSSGGDQRPGHIVDPRTGEPARGVLQATVVAPTAREADALSTAVFVLGAEEGLALAARRGVAALVLVQDDERWVIRTTRGFAAGHALLAAPGVSVREAEEEHP